MALQKTVNTLNAIGLPGQEVVIGQVDYLSYQVLSDGTVKAGGFVFPSSISGNGEDFAGGSATGEAGDVPLGIAVRAIDTVIASALDSHTEVYPSGAPVSIAMRGQIYIKVPTGQTAAEGDAIVVNPESGAISFGSASGASNTGWKVRIPNGGASAQADEIVIAEKY